MKDQITIDGVVYAKVKETTTPRFTWGTAVRCMICGVTQNLGIMSIKTVKPGITKLSVHLCDRCYHAWPYGSI